MRAYVSPTNAARRATLRTVLFAGVAAFALVGCNDVVSLAPAITDQDAYEVPDFVGEWRVRDTLTVDLDRESTTETGLRRLRVRRLDGPIPNYLVEAWAAGHQDSGKTAVFQGPYSYDARVGRLGRSFVLELRPAMEVDSLLIAAHDAYNPGLDATYQVLGMSVDGSMLHLWMVRGDSVQKAVTSGRCPGPYFVDPIHSSHMILTGSSEQVRAIWECVSALPGVVSSDSIVFLRMSR